jgi:hypothetical protein
MTQAQLRAQSWKLVLLLLLGLLVALCIVHS